MNVEYLYEIIKNDYPLTNAYIREAYAILTEKDIKKVPTQFRAHFFSYYFLQMAVKSFRIFVSLYRNPSSDFPFSILTLHHELVNFFHYTLIAPILK